jgi:hypothetical protein
VRSGELVCELVLEPLLGFMGLTLWTMAGATGMVDAVVRATVLALLEAVAIGAAVAGLDGADDFAVRGGEGGRALKVRWGTGGAEVAQGEHGRSPGMRELRRA